MKRNCKKNFIERKDITRQIKDMNFDNIFKDMIVEALLRRAKQYSFSKRRINQDIINLKANLKKITIVNGDIKDYELALAAYDANKKEILISTKSFEESPEIVFEIFCHELYHVLYKNKNGIDSFYRKNRLLMDYSSVYEELFVEKAAYKTVNKTNRLNRCFNKNAFGYDDIVFVLDMIEAAYGVNEQELLSNAIDGRIALTKFLALRGKESFEDAENFLEEIEVGAALLFSTTYPKNQQSTNALEGEYNMENSLETLYNCCTEKILCRLERYRNKSRREAVEMKNEIACCTVRLKNILLDRINFFEEYDGYNLGTSVKRNVSFLSDELTRRLSDIEQIIDEMNVTNKNSMLNLIEDAQYGDVSEERFMMKIGVAKRAKPYFHSSKQYEKKKLEPEWYCSEWDNSNVVLMIINLIEKWKLKQKKVNNEDEKHRKVEYFAASEDSSIMSYVMTTEEKKDYKERLKSLKVKPNVDSTSKENTEEHQNRE